MPLTCTLPKFTLAGLGVMVPTPLPVAVPDNGMAVLSACMSCARKRTLDVTDIETLVFTAMLPVDVPAAFGEYRTLKDCVAPGSKVKGRVTPLIWKSAPVTVSCETVRLVAPELVNVSGLVIV